MSARTRYELKCVLIGCALPGALAGVIFYAWGPWANVDFLVLFIPITWHLWGKSSTPPAEGREGEGMDA